MRTTENMKTLEIREYEGGNWIIVTNSSKFGFVRDAIGVRECLQSQIEMLLLNIRDFMVIGWPPGEKTYLPSEEYEYHTVLRITTERRNADTTEEYVEITDSYVREATVNGLTNPRIITLRGFYLPKEEIKERFEEEFRDSNFEVGDIWFDWLNTRWCCTLEAPAGEPDAAAYYYEGKVTQFRPDEFCSPWNMRWI